jgi:ATP-binding cassette, subfamily B, bacterial MsbA
MRQLKSIKLFQGKLNEADRLITKIARQNWRLLFVTFGTNISASLLEGASLGIIYLAVTVLTQPGGIDWNHYPFLSRFPAVTDLMNQAGRGVVFLWMLAAAVSAQLIFSLFNYLNLVSVGYLSAILTNQLTDVIHRQILRFSFACASRYKVGDLVYYASSAANTVHIQLVIVNDFLSNTFMSVVYLAAMLLVSPSMLLVAIVFAGILYFFQKRLLPQIRQTSQDDEAMAVKVTESITENVQGLRLLHTTGRQVESAEKVHQMLLQLVPLRKRQARLSNLATPLFQMIPILFLAILAGLTYLLFEKQSTNVLPALVTFVLALQRFNGRLQGLFSTFTRFAENGGRMQRLRTILDDRDKEFVNPHGLPFEGLQSAIVLQDVSLRYQTDQREILKEINLTLPLGKVTALVGQSGAGKSSLADLLVGLYEPTQGHIVVNGQDIRNYNINSWRRYLGVVSQDTFLLNASIRENIRFARPGATEEEVVSAARAAQADSFIQDLPEGYDTVIGERGYLLSGGQRQRIALARATLQDPELLILDEATSALDTESEHLVQEALEKFGHRRTMLVIAHRLSTIVAADQIIVLQSGQIVEQGDHHSLLQLGKVYARYWQLQSQDTVKLSQVKAIDS